MPIPSIRVVIAGVDQLSTTLGKALKGIKGFGDKAKQIGKALTLGLTVPIALFGANILRTAGDFEAGMNKVQNLTQATSSQFSALQETARTLGATTAFSATEAADAMGFLGMAGFTTDRILASIGDTLNLASASGMELGETADIMSNILTGYNINAKEAGRVTDVLTMGFQSTNTNLEQLGMAMSFVAPMASSMGVPLEEATAAIGQLSNAGIQGARAGTNLRAALAALGKPTAEAAKALERLRIPKKAIFDAEGNIRSLQEVIAAFEKSGARTMDFMAIFGRKMGPGMQALVSQGSKAFGELTKKLNESTGAAGRAAETRMKGFNGALKALTSAFEDLKLEIADSGLMEFALNLVQGLTKLIRKAAKLNPMLLKWGTIIAGIAAAIGPLLIVVGFLVSAIGSISAAVVGAGGVIALLSNPIGWVIAGILALIAVITVMTTMFDSKFTKIMMIVMPFAGVVAWIINRWERLLPFFKLFFSVWTQQMKALTFPIRVIWTGLFKVLGIAGESFTEVLDNILSLMEKIAKFVLPESALQSFGFIDNGTSTKGAIEEKAAMRRQNVKVNSEATLRFENAPPGLSIQSASPGMNFIGNTGNILPEAG